MREQCLILIKPEILQKSLTGNVISALSETGLRIVGAKIVKVSKELAEKHYSELLKEQIKKKGKKEGTKVYNQTLNYIRGKYHTDRVFALVYMGENAIEKLREKAGITNPEKSAPTTIRGRYGRINTGKEDLLETVIHVSDSPENAGREIQLWFRPEELTDVIYPTKKEESLTKMIIWK